MGYTVEEAQRKMSSREYTEWLLLFEMEDMEKREMTERMKQEGWSATHEQLLRRM